MHLDKDIQSFKLSIKNYRDYLQLIQGLTNLAPREMDVIAGFHREMRKLGVDYITPAVRKAVSDELSLSNINIYVKALKDKKMVLRNEKNELRLNPVLRTNDGQKGLLFLWK